MISNYEKSKSEEYQANVDLKMSYGRYTWCGNNYEDSKSGYYLSLTYDEIYGKKNKIMLDMTIKMNNILATDTHHIDIYDTTGFLAQYSVYFKDEVVHKLDGFSYYKFRFTVDKKLIGTNLNILFREFRNDIKVAPLARTPMRTIHKIDIMIPELVTYGDEKQCIICLDQIDAESDDKYITPCGHLYCLKCIFDYLNNKKLLIENTGHCVTFKCRHSSKPKNFDCPMCNSFITP